MTDKEWDKAVYAYGDNLAGYVAAELLLAHTGLYTVVIFCIGGHVMPSDVPIVETSEYYKDASMSLQDIVKKVEQGKMHPRAIPIAMELLL